jgi:hypothetical protein
MTWIFNAVKKLDSFASAEVQGTLVGGFLSIISYIVVAVLLVVYIVSAMNDEYPVVTNVGVFPNEAADAFLLPPINCVATSGCWIKAQSGTLDISGNSLVNNCLYLAQGEAMPDDYRYMYYNSDPVEFLQVLSKDQGENFALSYDVTKVTAYSATLTSTTTAAATDFSATVPMPYKIYRGASLMNLISTIGLDETIETWTNTVTTETSAFDGTGGCCGASVYDKDGGSLGILSTSDCTANYNTGSFWWTSKLVPPTTYAQVTVTDPLEPLLVFGLVGGWLGVIATICATAFWLYDDIKLFVGVADAVPTDDADANGVGDKDSTAVEMTKN